MAFVPYSKKTVRTSDPLAQPGSPPLSSLVQVCMEQDEPPPEQALGEFSMVTMGDADDGAYAEAGIQQVLEHNCALRRNFENLKQLHLQLSDSNLQLHEACLRLQEEKEELEKATRDVCDTKREKETLLSSIEDLKLSQEKELRLLKRERDEAAAIAGDLEARIRIFEKKVSTYKSDNKELVHKLEQIRMEKDQALASKHCAEMEHSRELLAAKVEDQTARQQAADLAHKCKHLELDLEKTLSAAEAAQQELLAITYERDSTVVNLEESLQRMEEDMFALQEQRKKAEQEWECERKKLLNTIESKEWQDQQTLRAKEEAETRMREDYELNIKCLQREKEESEQRYKEEADLCIKEALMDVRYEDERQRDLRRTLEGEAADLRAMLTAMEQASTDTEIRHTECIKELTKECESLRKELAEAKEKGKEAAEAFQASQKENAELMTEIEGLRAQLNDALNMNHENFTQIADYKRTRDEFERQTEHLKIELHDLKNLRERDQHDYVCGLEDAKRDWAAEKAALIRRECKAAEEQRRTLTHKNHSLKKKLKETSKLLATMTVDHNQLLVRTREIETQLSLAQTIRMMYVSHPADSAATPRIGKALERSSANSTWLKAEMAQLEKRQSQYLSSRREPSDGLRGAQPRAGPLPPKRQTSQHCIPCNPGSQPEKEVEDDRSREVIASLVTAADMGPY